MFFEDKDGEAWRSFIQSAKKKKKKDFELTGSDHEILIAKFRPKLKKIWKAVGHSGMT